MKYSTIGYKSTIDKIIFLTTGILTLIALNMILFGQMEILFFVVAIFGGILTYNNIRLYRNTRYTFDNDKLIITNKKKKSYTIPYSDITKITPGKLARFPRRSGSNSVSYHTSRDRLLAVHTKDGVTIYISPRTLKQRVKKKFGLTQKSHQ